MAPSRSRRTGFVATTALACLAVTTAAACGNSVDNDTVQADTEPTAIVWEDISPPISFAFADFNNQNFGAQTIVVAASEPSVVYLGTSYQGIWRTDDRGDSWTKTSTGRGGENLDTGRNWTLAVDPTDPDTLYTVTGYGQTQGIWKSVDGGVNWDQLLPDDVIERSTNDIYSIAIDPADPQHVIAGSHSGWAGGPSSGVLESKDGGTSWTLHEPQPSWGTGHYVFFLDSTTWLLTTQYDGFWRSADSGASWEKVTDRSMVHGGNQLYRTSDDVLYSGAHGTLLRSADEGRSWEEVGPETNEGYYAVIGDGRFLYTQHGYTGFNTVDEDPPYYFSPEDDGETWRPLNPAQVFQNGPMAMAFDPESRTLYSSNWAAGVWRLRL